MAFTEVDNQYGEIYLIGSETKRITVDEVGLFLYDLSSLYELVRLSIDNRYENYEFSQYSLYRNNRPLRTEDKLYVQRLQHESPILLVTTIAATTVAALSAIWVFTQIVEKIYNLPLNREKLKSDIELGKTAIRLNELQIQKLEREEISQTKSIISPDEAEDIFRKRGSIESINTVEKRLNNSPIQIREFGVKIRNPDKR
jgi:hypothetical protein